MLAERAALAYALVSCDLRLYPRRVFLAFFPTKNRPFGADTLRSLNEAAQIYAQRKETIPVRDRAFYEVLLADAHEVGGFLQRLLQSETFEPESVIKEAFQIAEKHLRLRLGLPWERLPISIHDTYPPPMDWQDTYAFTARHRISDQVGPGIYYKRDHLFPGLVEIATIHENIHVATPAPGQLHSLDNGIADFLAFAIYFDERRDPVAIRAYRDYLLEVSPTLCEYPIYFRAVLSLVQQLGMRGLLRLLRVRMGRPDSVDWHGLLEACRAGKIELADIPEADEVGNPAGFDELEEAALRAGAIGSYPDVLLVVSPLAYLVMNEIRTSGPIPNEAIRGRLRLDNRDFEEARAELIDFRLINSSVVSAGELLYVKPKDNFIASDALSVLGSRAVRVAPEVSVSAASVLKSLSHGFHTYAVAGPAVGPRDDENVR